MNIFSLLIKAGFLLLLLFLNLQVVGQGRGTQTEFGKNRVQYKDFDWFYHRSPTFDTYYYRGGKDLAERAGKIAEQQLKEVESFLDSKLEGRVQILCYNKQSDVRQTNLGLDDQFLGNTGGYTQLVGNKMFIYYDGSTEHLQMQIRAGIAQIMINQVLFGGNIQELLQSSTLLVLPDWFIPGLVKYIAENWTIDNDNQLKNQIESKKFKNFNTLVERDQELAGQSIWKFVVDNFGAPAVSNIIYMTRVNRNAESGFAYIIGLDYKNLSAQWLDYYKGIYANDATGKQLLPDQGGLVHKNKKRNKYLNYPQFKLSPDGHTLAYAINRDGRVQVFTYDVITKKTKKVFVVGTKTARKKNEGDEVVINWHPSGILLAIAFEKKSQSFIQVVNINDSKDNFRVDLYKYEKILDFSYAPNGRKWVMSAIKNGQSDIFVFDITSRRDEQITNDWFDDFNPTFFYEGQKIIFSSNRTLDSLKTVRYESMPPLNNLNLFAYDYVKRDPVLQKISYSELSNETKPQVLDSNRILFLSDQLGVQNFCIATMDSVLDYTIDTNFGWLDTTLSVYKDTFTTAPLTNFSSSILQYNYLPKHKKGARMYRTPNGWELNEWKLESLASSSTEGEKKITYFKSKQDEKNGLILKKLQQEIPNDTTKSSVTKKDSSKIDINNYFFQSEFSNTPRKANKSNIGTSIATAAKPPVKLTLADYFKKTPSPYLPLFSINSTISQLDNSYLTEDYQLFTGSGPIFFENALNALIKFGSSDILEDYRFTGGFRLGFSSFNIPEYYLTFSHLKKRLDKQITFYKNEKQTITPFFAFTLKTFQLSGKLKYPFTEFSSVRFTGMGRIDQGIVYSTDSQTLSFPSEYQRRLGAKVEYVYDNVVPKGINLFNGTRGKVYFEYIKNLETSTDVIKNIGIDVRHYEKIHRNIIFAARLAGAASFGNQKVIYYLGGVDGWLLPRFDNNTQILTDQNYFYHALATNMRGFNQNIRNGNTFMVTNLEIRFPVISYFVKTPMKSDFLKNLQVVPFFDAGASWKGWNLFSEQNRQNIFTSNNGPVTVNVIQTIYPIVGGFGWGIRSRLLGYFVRLDFAYGIENGFVRPRKNYFSLSLDF